MRTGGGLWTGVVVTEGAAAHGNRLAMEPTGHSVTTFGDHDGPLLRVMGYPHPLRVFWDKLAVFNGLAARFYGKNYCFQSSGSQIPENGELTRSRARDRAGRDAAAWFAHNTQLSITC